MKAILKWFSGVVAVVLVIVLTPYAARLADLLLPDISGTQIKHAAILSQQMQDSARLETLVVSGEGAINAEVDALFLGTVSSVNATYAYEGSYGIDLSKVQLTVQGSKIIFHLPAPEVLRDDVTIIDIYRDGILDRAVRIGDKELQSLLDGERQQWRDQYLTGENAAALRDATIRAVQSTVVQWMSQTNSRLQYEFVWADATE